MAEEDPTGDEAGEPTPSSPVAAGEWPDDPSDPAGYPAEGRNSLPSLGQRALARISDFVVSILLPGFALSTLVAQYAVERDGDEYEVTNPTLVVVLFVLALLIPFVYETAMVAWRGQTLGKILGKLEVVRFGDGGPVAPRAAAIRGGIPVLFLVLAIIPALALVGQLGYLSMFLSGLLDKQTTRTWPDKVAKTIVVKSR